jgi:transcriptional regulator with XRE-family HTH domain
LIKVTPMTETVSESIRMEQGRRILAARNLRGITQDELAAACRVSGAAVSAWEHGKASPRAFIQTDVAQALGVTWFSLFGLEAS